LTNASTDDPGKKIDDAHAGEASPSKGRKKKRGGRGEASSPRHASFIVHDKSREIKRKNFSVYRGNGWGRGEQKTNTYNGEDLPFEWGNVLKPFNQCSPTEERYNYRKIAKTMFFKGPEKFSPTGGKKGGRGLIT